MNFHKASMPLWIHKMTFFSLFFSRSFFQPQISAKTQVTSNKPETKKIPLAQLVSAHLGSPSDTDNRFFWNRMFFIPFIRYDVNGSDWLLKVMCGSVEVRTVYVGSRQAKAAVISRLSSGKVTWGEILILKFCVSISMSERCSRPLVGYSESVDSKKAF